MKNAFFQLPFLFSEKLLLKDLEYCQLNVFTSHYNTKDYSGDWKSIALRSLNGDPDQIYAHASGSENYQDTFLLDSCPYFKEVIDSFNCQKESVRLLNLLPKSKIHEHTDHNLGYEDGTFRVHIPIKTNPGVHFYINNIEILMQVRECWYVNFNLPHKVENNGSTDRIHLVIDCIRNDWSDQLFKKAGYDFDFESSPLHYDKETKLRIIEELRRMNTETSKNLSNQLTSEL